MSCLHRDALRCSRCRAVVDPGSPIALLRTWESRISGIEKAFYRHEPARFIVVTDADAVADDLAVCVEHIPLRDTVPVVKAEAAGGKMTARYLLMELRHVADQGFTTVDRGQWVLIGTFGRQAGPEQGTPRLDISRLPGGGIGFPDLLGIDFGGGHGEISG